MMFQDMSCESEHTLESHRIMGLYDLLGADWAGIIIVTRWQSVRIDAKLDLSGTCDGFAEAYLEKSRGQLFQLDFGETGYYVFDENDGQVLIYFARETDEYRVYSLYCKEHGRFDPKDVRWAEIYTMVNYNNVLLNNELVQEKDYLENVLESCDSQIVVFDLNGAMVSANGLAGKAFGPGLVNLNRNIPVGHKTLLNAIQSVVETEQKVYLKDVSLLSNDLTRIFNVTLAPLRNSKNIIAGAVMVCNDVTEQKYMQQEVDLLEQYALLGEISMGLAHDIKNPLMNIRCCANLIGKSSHAEDGRKDICEIIIHEVDRITRVMNQMMSFGNVSAETGQTEVNLDEVIYNCIQILERQKGGRTILFHQKREENLPLLKARMLDMQQIFLNLLLNSVQAITDEGEISAESWYDERGNRIVVSIVDNGMGIAPEIMGKIFTPFFSTKADGTGLGLFLVRKALGQYGGTIHFSNAPGGGTICKVILPYHPDRAMKTEGDLCTES